MEILACAVAGAAVWFDPDKVTAYTVHREISDTGATPSGAVTREHTGRTSLTLYFGRAEDAPRIAEVTGL